MKMKNNIKAALIALTSALLITAASCGEPKEQTPRDVCQMAKFIKDSTLNANANISAEVNL